MKKLLALLLAAVLCLGVLAGCGPTGGGIGGGYEDIEGGSLDTSGPLFSEMTTIEITMSENVNYPLGPDTFLVDILKDENIDLKITPLSDFSNVFNQMLSDQALPDLVPLGVRDISAEYGPDGAFIDFNQYINNGKMPNVKKWLDENPEAWKIYTDDDGKMYGLPTFDTGSVDPYAYIYRADIFEKHNIEFATDKDGFYDMLKQLKQLYPDSYPFVLRQMTGNMQGFMYLCAAWGTNMALPGASMNYLDFDYETGEFYYGPTSDNMKEMLEFFNKLMDEGLMHPSSITLTSPQWTEAFATGKSFVGFDKMDRIPIQLQPAGETMIEGFELKAAAPFAYNDDGLAATTYGTGDASSQSFSVASSAKNKDAIIKFLDWLYSEEGIIMTNWGKEGVTYEVGEDGKLKWLDSILEEPDPQFTRGLRTTGLMGVADYDAYIGWQTEAHKADIEMANQYAGAEGAKMEPYLKFDKAQMLVFTTYGQALHGYARAEIQKFIVGERDFSTWSSFHSECEAVGYNQLLKIHRDAYNKIYGE